MRKQRRKGRRIAGIAAVLLCAFLAGCGAETAPDYTSSVNFDGYIEAAAQDTGDLDGIRPAIRLFLPQ